VSHRNSSRPRACFCEGLLVGAGLWERPADSCFARPGGDSGVATPVNVHYKFRCYLACYGPPVKEFCRTKPPCKFIFIIGRFSFGHEWNLKPQQGSTRSDFLSLPRRHCAHSCDFARGGGFFVEERVSVELTLTLDLTLRFILSLDSRGGRHE
jgi:hypothetical protein